MVRAPGKAPVAGWSILIQLIQALEPDLPLRTILDIARSQETRPNGDITAHDIDSLASLSPMLQEPFTAVCTPIRSPVTDAGSQGSQVSPKSRPRPRQHHRNRGLHHHRRRP